MTILVDGNQKSGKLTHQLSGRQLKSHYLEGFSTIQPVVGLGISEALTVSVFLTDANL